MDPVTITNGTVGLQSTVSSKEEVYDYPGAMYFTVAVVLIYGLSIVALIATHMKGESRDDKDESRQVSKYFLERDQMQRKGELERLMWLQSNLGMKRESSDSEWFSSSENINNFSDSPDTDWPPQYDNCESQTTAPNLSELSLILEEDDVFVQLGETLPAENGAYHSDNIRSPGTLRESFARLQNQGHQVRRPTDLSISIFEGNDNRTVHESSKTSYLTENMKSCAPNLHSPTSDYVEKVSDLNNGFKDMNRNATHVLNGQSCSETIIPCETDLNLERLEAEHIWQLRSDLNI